MRRIVYLNPFGPAEISGGIKVMFRHVEMLVALGFDSMVYSPHGVPTWLHSSAPIYRGANPGLDSGNLLVFPEVLDGAIREAVLTPMAAAKALLCQNQYFMFNQTIPQQSLAQLGFVKLLTVGEVARGFLERVFSPARFDVVPVWVDGERFAPRPKSLRIAVFPRKLPRKYALIRRIFELKYPAYAGIPWDVIVDKSEAQTAQILGGAALFLSLCDQECSPLTLLEAMASGCVIVGFHGYGGLEYADERNGVWMRPDYLEETADELARAVQGLTADEERYQGMAAAARATAARFSQDRTALALKRVFADVAPAAVLRPAEA